MESDLRRADELIKSLGLIDLTLSSPSKERELSSAQQLDRFIQFLYKGRNAGCIVPSALPFSSPKPKWNTCGIEESQGCLAKKLNDTSHLIGFFKKVVNHEETLYLPFPAQDRICSGPDHRDPQSLTSIRRDRPTGF